MPAVRDVVFSQEAVTTDAGLTLPMPSYVTGDIVVVIGICDIAVTGWTCSNGVGSWNALFAVNNTNGMAGFWKYATAGEGDIVLSSATADTYCGFAVTIRDAFQGYTSGSPPVVNAGAGTASANRASIGGITTTGPNSLVLVGYSTSATNPGAHIVEAKAINLAIVNGTAEGGALGWFVQRAAGATPSDIYASIPITSPGGVRCTIEMKEPAGGALVIPTYVASDPSVYFWANPGRVYDGSTVLAATADTNFGTLLGGVTANDATVTAAIIDAGVDPKGFIETAGITNVASATAISGAEVVVPASKYNIGNSNILGHLRPANFLASQNLGAIGTTRGAWFGMRSGAAAGNYKIWQIAGGDSPYYGLGIIPFVVNNANTDTRASAGTLSNVDVRGYGYWTSGVGVLTGQMTLGPLWKMDTTVIAGGVAAEPIGIPGLAEALSKGRIRWSALQQGANQLLCLQAVQFGNGGTDGVYLDLNATAIEFPSKRNAAAKLVNYNGADNSVGITYYAGASDTIKHRASVVSSSSPYHWHIHAGSSSSATYDFKGLAVIGAGTVQLRAVTTFTGMAFTSCPSIAQNSAVVNGCTFTGSKITSATLGDMANVSGCSFTSSGTGHAIEVSGTSGTISFSGNTFIGYAVSNGITGNEAIYVNIATGIVTINVTGGGSTPSIRTAGATVLVQNAVTVKVTVKDAATLNPIQNARVLLEKSSDGTDIMTGLTNASGVITASYAYSGDTAVTGSVRRATVAYGTLYKPNGIVGTITASGFDVTILLTSDE